MNIGHAAARVSKSCEKQASRRRRTPAPLTRTLLVTGMEVFGDAGREGARDYSRQVVDAGLP